MVYSGSSFGWHVSHLCITEAALNPSCIYIYLCALLKARCIQPHHKKGLCASPSLLFIPMHKGQHTKFREHKQACTSADTHLYDKVKTKPQLSSVSHIFSALLAYERVFDDRAKKDGNNTARSRLLRFLSLVCATEFQSVCGKESQISYCDVQEESLIQTVTITGCFLDT